MSHISAFSALRILTIAAAVALTSGAARAQANCDSVVYAPAQDSHGLMLFEDNWPSNGDLDFNDQGIAWSYELALDGSKNVVALDATFNVLSVGANFHNGLYLHLPGIAPGAISSATLVDSLGGSASVTPVSGETDLVLQILADTRSLFTDQSGFINTEASLPTETASKALRLQLTFNAPIGLDPSAAPFDLFIARSDNYDWQIHRPQYNGTSAALPFLDAHEFHQLDDGSAPGRWFVNTAGLPFALELPQVIDWPQERASIDTVYTDITEFGSSGGTENLNWYASGHGDAALEFSGGAAQSQVPAPIFVSAGDPFASCLPSAARSTLALQNGSSASNPADGATAAQLLATVFDNGGNPIAGATVVLAFTGTASIEPASALTDVNGNAAFTLTSSTINDGTVSAVINPAGQDLAIPQTVALSFVSALHQIGGSVSGLTGSGLVLATAGEPNLTIPAGATGFNFADPVATDTAYDVSIVTQPSNPTQLCSVAAGSGSALGPGDVTTIGIVCGALPYATARINDGGITDLVFLYAPAGSDFTAPGSYDAYCIAGGFQPNKTGSAALGMEGADYDPTDYYCNNYCCFLGSTNGQAEQLVGFQNHGLPLNTGLRVIDRGCGEWCSHTYAADINTTDALYVGGPTSFGYVPNAYGVNGQPNACGVKTIELPSDGVLICQLN